MTQDTRRLALARDRGVLAGVQLYAQLAVGLAVFLYDRVSTPGYWSLLLTAPYLALIWALARQAKKRLEAGPAAVSLGRGLSMALALLCLLDAQLVFYALCAVAADVLPDLPPLSAPLALALTMGLCLSDARSRCALPRMARLIRWIAAGALGFCMLCALPCGKAAHFFPLLGRGLDTVGRGALWMCGACAGCVWSWLLPAEEGPAPGKTLLFPLAYGLLAGVATMLVSVWLMPFFFMARPETAGWRLLALTNMTPSVPAWSLNVLGLAAVLLPALCASLSQASDLLGRFCVRSRPSPVLAFMLPCLLIPASALPGALETLVRIAPWRAAATPAALLLLIAGVHLKRRKSCNAR